MDDQKFFENFSDFSQQILSQLKDGANNRNIVN